MTQITATVVSQPIAASVSGSVIAANVGSSTVTANAGGGGAATTSASDLTSGTLSQARLDFTPIHPFLLMGG